MNASYRRTLIEVMQGRAGIKRQPVFHPIEILLESLGLKGLDCFSSKFVFILVLSVKAMGNVGARLIKQLIPKTKKYCKKIYYYP